MTLAEPNSIQLEETRSSLGIVNDEKNTKSSCLYWMMSLAAAMLIGLLALYFALEPRARKHIPSNNDPRQSGYDNKYFYFFNLLFIRR